MFYCLPGIVENPVEEKLYVWEREIRIMVERGEGERRERGERRGREEGERRGGERGGREGRERGERGREGERGERERGERGREGERGEGKRKRDELTKEKEGLKGVEKRTRNGMTNRGEEKGETESLSYSSQRIDRGIYHQTTPGSMWHTELNVVYVGLELSREFKVCGGWFSSLKFMDHPHQEF